MTKRCKLHPIIPFLLLLVSWPAQAEPLLLDRVVAVVDSDLIMQSELISRTALIRQQLIERGTRLPSADILQEQVLEKLILDRIQLQLAGQNGIRITDTTLDSTMLRIADSNNMNLEQFKRTLEAEGQNYREVREQVRDEMVITQTREKLVNRRISISEREIENFLATGQGQEQSEPELHLAHILIAQPSPATPAQIKAAETEAREIHAQLQAGEDFSELAVARSDSPQALNGGDLGWRKASEMPDDLAPAIKALQVGEFTQPLRTTFGVHLFKLIERRGGGEQLVQQTQVRHILIKPSTIRTEQEARALAFSLHARLNAGEAFADLAKTFSDDPGSGATGGDLGWAMPGQMVPEFEQAMDATPIDSLSAPFKSRFGWHILEVQARRQQDFGEQIQNNKAREQIRKRKFNEELDSWLREIKAQAYIEIKRG